MNIKTSKPQNRIFLMAIISILLIALIALIVGIYIVIKQGELNKNIYDGGRDFLLKKVGKEAISGDRQYINKDFNFSFSYPSNFILEERTYYLTSTSYAPSLIVELRSATSTDSTKKIEIDVVKTAQDITNDTTFIKKFLSKYYSIKEETVVLNNVESVQNFLAVFRLTIKELPYQLAYVKKNDRFYIIQALNTDILNGTYQEILKTFRLVE